MKIKNMMLRLCACLLLLASLLALPMPAFAEDNQPMPIASQYISSYGAAIAPQGSGVLRVRFNIVAFDTMDELGSAMIMLYESTDNVNFSCIKVFLPGTYTNMIGYNESYYSTYVSYQATAGRYYKCYVTYSAVMDDQEERRFQWTTVVQAT